MKTQFRTLGIDDAKFKFREDEVPVVGAVIRGNSYLEAVLCTRIKVDGRDANDKLTQMINRSKYKEQVRTIMLDGIAVGGFNVIDVNKLYKTTGISIITITRREPNLVEMKNALRKHFDDWEERWEIIKGGRLEKIETRHKPAWISCTGIDVEEAKRIIELITVRGVLPEPIRVAHLIASAMVSGESYGRP